MAAFGSLAAAGETFDTGASAAELNDTEASAAELLDTEETAEEGFVQELGKLLGAPHFDRVL